MNKMVDHAFARKRIAETLWEAEHEAEIHAISRKRFEITDVGDAFNELPDSVEARLRELIFDGNREKELAEFFRNTVIWYLFNFSKDDLRNRHEWADAGEVVDHPSLTAAQRNGVKGTIPGSEL